MAKKDSFGNFDSKELKAFIAEIERGRKETNVWRETLDGFSSTFFGFSSAAFFKEVPKSVNQMAAEFKAANIAMGELQTAGLGLQDAFANKKIVDSVGNTRSAMDALRSSITRTMTDGTSAMDDVLDKMEQAQANNKNVWSQLSLDEQVNLGKLLNSEGFEFLSTITNVEKKSELIQKILFQQEERFIKNNKESLDLLATHESIRDVMNTEVTALDDAEKKYKRLSAEMRQTMKTPSFLQALNNGLGEMGKNLREKVMTNLNDVDIGIHEIQRNTGVMIAQNTAGLNRWTSGMAQYGMTIADAAQMMEGLGAALATTNQGVLMDATTKFRMMTKSLGISNEEMTSISASMMRVGSSADDVADAMDLANKSAKLLGVSTKRVTQQIAKNIDKMQSLGFKGGVQALTIMAAKAEKLGMQVDDIFNVAERARSIEGAMDMAAQLQLAGGSFSNINPMELLSAARNSPEELQKILASMGKDLGHWNKEMGTYDFNPIDYDKIKIAAEAAGMSVEKFQDMIRKGAMLDKKTVGMGESMFSSLASSLSNDIKGIDADMAKGMLGDFLELGENGEVKLTSDFKKAKLLDKAGIKSIADLNENNIKGLLDISNKDTKSLKEQAEQNMSLSETFNAFTASLTNLFTVFQPILNGFTEVITMMSDALHSAAEKLHEVFGEFGDWIIPTLTTATVVFKSKIFDVVKKALSTIGEKILFRKKDADNSGGIGGLAGSMRQVSDRAGGIKEVNLGRFALALGIIGAAVIGFMAGLKLVGGTPGLRQLAGAAGSMLILGSGIWALSKMSPDNENIVNMALAMAIIGAAMIPFAFAMNMMSGMNWEEIGASLAMMGLAVLGVMALGAIMASGFGVVALEAGAWALVSVGAAMALAGAGFLAAAMAMEKLAGIDWGGITKMGAAMLSAAPGMIAFGIATMAFANPIAMLGMGLMVLQLTGLALVMVPLAAAMAMTSDSMSKFVSSIDKFKSSVRGADLGGVFSAISQAIEQLGDVMEDADMERISEALSSINVSIDTSSVDGLKNAITSMPSIIVHVDRSDMDKMMGSLSSIKMGMDKAQMERDMASLPSVKVALDVAFVRDQLKGMSEVSIKVDTKALMDAAASLPPLSVDVDTSKLMSIMSSMPVLKAKLDTSEVESLIKQMPSITISVDQQAFNDAVSSMPSMKLSIDTSEVVKSLSELPAATVTVDTRVLLEKLSSLPPVRMSLDMDGVAEQLAMVSQVRIRLDMEELTRLAPLEINIDTRRIDEQLAAISSPTIRFVVDTEDVYEKLDSLKSIAFTVDVNGIMDQISTIKSIEFTVDTKGLSDQLAALRNIEFTVDTKGLSDQLAALRNIEFTVDTKGLSDQLTALRSIEFTVDTKGLSDQLMVLRSIEFTVDTTNLSDQLASLRNIEFTVDTKGLSDQLMAMSLPSLEIVMNTQEAEAKLAMLSTIKISVDVNGVKEQVAALSAIRIPIDTGNLENLTQSVRVVIDRESLLKAFAFVPEISVRINTSNIEEQLSALPSINLGFELDGMKEAYSMMSDMGPVHIEVDIEALKTMLDIINDVPITINASEVYEAVASLPSLSVTANVSSIVEQLTALPPISLSINRSDIERMTTLLSSIQIALDVSAIESAVSGLKIGIDTSHLDKSVSDLKSVDLQGIGGTLASIEATISKISEERLAAIRVAPEELGASTKMQMELMARLSDSIDRLSTASSSEQKDRRIVVELEMDGRQIKTKILKDTSIVT